jgi:hypothetical protein
MQEKKQQRERLIEKKRRQWKDKQAVWKDANA